MVNRKRKYESGAATAYMSRSQALKKLQVSLPDFRRMCILKGIYPHEPKNKKQAGKGSTAPRTYYLAKDIRYLLHEPVLHKFREFKAFLKKIERARNRKEDDEATRRRRNKPVIQLDHIVKERYPSFIDAVRDLDDAISMCCLFSTFPLMQRTVSFNIQLCRRLTVEFMHYVISSQSLRKVFVSIKGIYLQADIVGETITWIVPHQLGYSHPTDVDHKIMATFVDFYCTMLGFVNYRLYNMLGLHYPPQLQLAGEKADTSGMCTEQELKNERLSALTQCLESVTSSPEEPELEMDHFPSAEGDDPDQVEKAKVEAEELKKFQKLFSNLKCFLNREVPREILTFCIRSFGGQVSWDSTVAVGYSYPVTDETITHHIIDRPSTTTQYLSRYYVQPQWVFDCINARRVLPVEEYFLGAVLPPHLSPFVEEKEGDYVPPEKRALMGETASDSGVSGSDDEISDEIDDEAEQHNSGDEDTDRDDDESDDEQDKELSEAERLYADQRQKRKMAEVEEPETEDRNVNKKAKVSDKTRRQGQMAVVSGQVEKDERQKKIKKSEDEERKLGEMMIPKKKRHMYNKMVYGKKRRSREAKVLEEKRKTYDTEQKKQKKKAKK